MFTVNGADELMLTSGGSGPSGMEPTGQSDQTSVSWDQEAGGSKDYFDYL